MTPSVWEIWKELFTFNTNWDCTHFLLTGLRQFLLYIFLQCTILPNRVGFRELGKVVSISPPLPCNTLDTPELNSSIGTFTNSKSEQYRYSGHYSGDSKFWRNFELTEFLKGIPWNNSGRIETKILFRLAFVVRSSSVNPDSRYNMDLFYS